MKMIAIVRDDSKYHIAVWNEAGRKKRVEEIFLKDYDLQKRFSLFNVTDNFVDFYLSY